MTGDAALPSIIASLVAASLCVLSGCGNPERVAESSAELNKKLSDQSRLSNMNWEEIRTIGIPLAVRQAITEKCFGTSHGEFSNYLYDLTSVGVPDELIEDIRESGGYMAQNVTCDNEFIQVSEDAAALAHRDVQRYEFFLCQTLAIFGLHVRIRDLHHRRHRSVQRSGKVIQRRAFGQWRAIFGPWPGRCNLGGAIVELLEQDAIFVDKRFVHVN